MASAHISRWGHFYSLPAAPMRSLRGLDDALSHSPGWL
jgi:hypothetical protein